MTSPMGINHRSCECVHCYRVHLQDGKRNPPPIKQGLAVPPPVTRWGDWGERARRSRTDLRFQIAEDLNCDGATGARVFLIFLRNYYLRCLPPPPRGAPAAASLTWIKNSRNNNIITRPCSTVRMVGDHEDEKSHRALRGASPERYRHRISDADLRRQSL